MRVLATTDGSERSLHVLPHAARLARAAGGELLLLHVRDDGGGLDEAGLCDILERSGVGGRAIVTPLLRGEEVETAILRVAAAEQAEALALDSRGHGSLKHALLGSVALSVLAGSDLPILTTGPAVQPPRADPGYHVALAAEGTPPGDAALRAMAPILQAAAGRVTLVQVYTPRLGDRGDETEMREAAQRIDELESRLPGGDAMKLEQRAATMGLVDMPIIEAAVGAGADVIVAPSHGWDARRHLLQGSTGALLLGSSPLPIVLIHA
jgi:nucleotide-binding universal stress UspA family protein